MNTASVGLAVTPAVVSTLLSHYLNRKPLAHKPTEHLSYDEGLHLIRSFLEHSSKYTVEDLQAFSSQWVPHPQWVRVDHVEIPEDHLSKAADLLIDQLGPEGLRKVGGSKWWQWRKPKSPLKAEWIEMKADYRERRKRGDPGNRVMLYVHGGAYYFGSIDMHRYQIQRHARKLKARALAPDYRLAPQFPFPCGLQDCLATYLWLISQQKPSTVILAGDSAGGGMVLSMLVVLRDRGIPLPAGAVLISPWCDLTHSFPSVAEDCPLDYIPPTGFHHKPSIAWPPPDEEELKEMSKLASGDTDDGDEKVNQSEKKASPTTPLSVIIDGENVEIKEQIQMYTTNELITHPLVSPVLQPTLGGLPPLLVLVGGGEILRDEQIYLAHKAANPSAYLPPEACLDEEARALIDRYPPTDVQLQVWDDLCHVVPTLSFTRPAKLMFRSIAQFSAWALARAQESDIEIQHDDHISVITSSSDSSLERAQTHLSEEEKKHATSSIGKAGDPLPPFENHMIRQRVTRHGRIFPLAPPEELPGCCMPREDIGVIKESTARKWLDKRRKWDARFADARARVRRQRLRDASAGFETFGEGENPPPSALAGRRKIGVFKEAECKRKRVKSFGMSLWATWGAKHDLMVVKREKESDKAPEQVIVNAEQGQGARTFESLEKQEEEVRHREEEKKDKKKRGLSVERFVRKSRSWRDLFSLGKSQQEQNAKDVPPVPPLVTPASDEKTTENKTETTDNGAETEATNGQATEPVANEAPTKENGDANPKPDEIAEPHAAAPADGETGVTGKRVFLGGVAMPFSLRKEADSASLMTLMSTLMTPGLPPSINTTQAEGAEIEVPSPVTETAGHTAEGEKTPVLPPTTPTVLINDPIEEEKTTVANGDVNGDDTKEVVIELPEKRQPELARLDFSTPLPSPALTGDASLERFITADSRADDSPKK